MRVRLAMLALILSVPAVAAGPAASGRNVSSTPAAVCAHASPYVAAESSLYRGKPLPPQELTKLPPAKTYMAVYRQIDGCEVPLTMVQYRGHRSR